MNDVYSYKFSDALTLVCPSEQSQVQAGFQSASILSIFKMNIDTSHLSYNLQSESWSDATVAVTGSITANSLTTDNTSDIVTLETNGLWWCIITDNAGNSG